MQATSGGSISLKVQKVKVGMRRKKVFSNISSLLQTTRPRKMQDSRGGQGNGEEQEEFLDLCDKVKQMTEEKIIINDIIDDNFNDIINDKVKQMTEEKARKRKHEDAPSGNRPAAAPSLVYGPIDWRVPPEKEKEIKEKAMRKVVVEEEEDKGEMEGEEEEGMEGVPKKKGKIKRRGKKKGKRNKPDREEEEKKKKEGENAMDC